MATGRLGFVTFNVTRAVLSNLRGSSVRMISIATKKHCSSSSSDSGSNSDFEDNRDEEFVEAKFKIFREALNFVPQYGWSKKALVRGAEAAGLPPLAHGMIEGPAQLINYFYQDCNSQLAGILKQETETKERTDEKLFTTEFIRSAVETRLRMITPYLDTWPQAMAIQTLPQNAVQSWSNLSTLVDDIWYYAGDRSTDFNWYTKRVSLAAVYKSTEIVMVQDKSTDFEETFFFLDRRLDDLINASKLYRKCDQFSEQFSEGMKGSLIMARNVLGMNSRSR